MTTDNNAPEQAISLRVPTSTLGAPVHALIAACPPLDPNSLYCNLLQCSHFANTSVAAFLGDQLVGFISGYIIPGQPDTLFVWQVAVHEKGRQQGLASRMLHHILARDVCRPVRFIETTITEDNAASWRLFLSFAEKMAAETHKSIKFDRQQHFAGRHDSEWLLRIGPFDTVSH